MKSNHNVIHIHASDKTSSSTCTTSPPCYEEYTSLIICYLVDIYCAYGAVRTDRTLMRMMAGVAAQYRLGH